ncbi:MAG: quinoprotein relay system zinc metallohydrolase 2 [Nitrosomonadales bacterium]
MQISSQDFQEVADGVYVHYGQHLDVDEGYQGDICNIGFIVGKSAIAIIDTGGSPEVAQKLKNFIQQNFSQPIKYVINTHPHLDHIYGNKAFLDLNPVFIGHEQLQKAMRFRKDLYTRLNQKYLYLEYDQIPQVEPTESVTLAQPLSIDLGERILKLEAFEKSHTEADLTVHDLNTNTFWSGDLIFNERTPVIDGDIHGYLRVLKNLQAKQLNIIVPGHGKAGAAKILIKQMQQYLEVLRNDVRKSIDAGMSLEKTMSSAAQSEEKHWQLFKIQNQRNINRIYPEMEWE